MALRLKTAATSSPVSVAEVKSNSRISTAADDALIQALIDAAVLHVERVTGRALCAQVWQLLIDAFPVGRNAIEIEKAPVTSVVSITYIDAAGATQALASANYELSIESDCAYVVPSYGVDWPVAREKINAVTIEFAAGSASAESVPADIKRALLLLVGHWYENREAVVSDARVSQEIVPFGFDALLSPYRLMRFV